MVDYAGIFYKDLKKYIFDMLTVIFRYKGFLPRCYRKGPTTRASQNRNLCPIISEMGTF